ncbi:MAG: ABC transporter permease [Bacteroidaceae bacterium]|nr:ABC transporter permease [Bacteroidaceae bacterium]
MLAYLLLFKREFLRMAARPVYWFVMVIAPLGVYAFFVMLMQAGLPSELPVGLVDLDNTATSRSIARNLDAFQRTKIAAHYADVSEARRALQRGDVYAFYYIPRGTTRGANRQEQPTVSFYINYSYLIAGSLTYQDMRMMSELASGAAARRVLYAKGATEGQAMAYLQPVVMDTHPISNPWLNYNIYLSNTIVPGMLLLFISLLTAYSLGTEIKDGTAREWMALAGGSIKRAVTVKLVPQFVVFWLMGAVYVLLFYAYLHFPCHCGIPVMLGAMTLLVLAGQGLGTLFFALLPSLRMSMSMCALWGVVSFSTCGMSFPVMAMHPAIQGLTQLFPLRHYFLIYINCALDGFPWQYAAWNFLALFFFAAAPLLLMPRLKYSVLNYKYVP